MLLKIVDREDNELLLVVITILKKHSIFLGSKIDNGKQKILDYKRRYY